MAFDHSEHLKYIEITWKTKKSIQTEVIRWTILACDISKNFRWERSRAIVVESGWHFNPWCPAAPWQRFETREFAHESVVAAGSLETCEEGKNFRKAAEPLQRRSYIHLTHFPHLSVCSRTSRAQTPELGDEGLLSSNWFGFIA